MQSELARKYAQHLDARAISELASWCEMAFNGLIGREDAAQDRETFKAAAIALRALQPDCYRSADND